MTPMVVTGVLYFLLFSVIVGQVVRVPLFGQSGGLLVSDITVVAVIVVAGIKYYVSGSRNILTTYYLLLTTPFILWSLLTLILHASQLVPSELIIADSYWARTSAYLLLLPALIFLVSEKTAYRTLQRGLMAATLILVGLGVGQLLVWPHLTSLPAILLATSGGGWDPHEGRLVGTWLDPNFLGAFLGIALIYAATRLRSASGVLLVIATTGALIATQSRSSVIATLSALLILSPLSIVRWITPHRRLNLPAIVATLSAVGLCASVAVIWLGDRALGLVTFDPTIMARQQSLASLWQFAGQHALTGVGYNAFQFATAASGLSADATLHSRAGADNSFLTLAITTGIPGVLLFCLPWLTAAHECGKRWLRHGDGVALAALTSLLMLTIHAQFINSWLYGHLLITIASVTALALTKPLVHDHLVR